MFYKSIITKKSEQQAPEQRHSTLRSQQSTHKKSTVLLKGILGPRTKAQQEKLAALIGGEQHSQEPLKSVPHSGTTSPLEGRVSPFTGEWLEDQKKMLPPNIIPPSSLQPRNNDGDTGPKNGEEQEGGTSWNISEERLSEFMNQVDGILSQHQQIKHGKKEAGMVDSDEESGQEGATMGNTGERGEGEEDDPFASTTRFRDRFNLTLNLQINDLIVEGESPRKEHREEEGVTPGGTKKKLPLLSMNAFSPEKAALVLEQVKARKEAEKTQKETEEKADADFLHHDALRFSFEGDVLIKKKKAKNKLKVEQAGIFEVGDDKDDSECSTPLSELSAEEELERHSLYSTNFAPEHLVTRWKKHIGVSRLVGGLKALVGHTALMKLTQKRKSLHAQKAILDQLAAEGTSDGKTSGCYEDLVEAVDSLECVLRKTKPTGGGMDAARAWQKRVESRVKEQEGKYRAASIRAYCAVIKEALKRELNLDKQLPHNRTLGWLVNLPEILKSNPDVKGGIDLQHASVNTMLMRWKHVVTILVGDPLKSPERKQWFEQVKEKVKAVDAASKEMAEKNMEDLDHEMQINPKVHWLKGFYASNLDPQYACELLFTLFCYTVDHRFCDCTSYEECQKLPPGHQQWPGKPTNFDCWGSNSSIWAVANWTMRVSQDPDVNKGIRELSNATMQLYMPFIERLEEALALLPKARRAVFRGVRVRIAKNFRLNSEVIFPPFTSTSLVGREAEAFMNKFNLSGCFFVITSHSGSMVNFCSWYPEQAESLLSSFRCFLVKKKMSRTILQMLGRKYDIVTMHEMGDNASDEEIVESLIATAKQITFVYDGYLDSYIESKLAFQPPPQVQTMTLFQVIDKFVHQTDSFHRHLLLLGGGGSGKTSATLAVLSRLTTKYEDSIFTIFLPLPSIHGLFTRDKALDEHIMETLALKKHQVHLLLQKRTIVLLLDSLDECGEIHEMALRKGILPRNPLASLMRVIMSSRDEALRAFQSYPATALTGERCATNCTVLHVQPFSDSDVNVYIKRQMSQLFHDKANVDAVQLEQKVTQTIQRIRDIHFLGNLDVIHHPVTLHMIVCVLASDKYAAQLRGNNGLYSGANLYQAFLRWHILEKMKFKTTLDMEEIFVNLSAMALEMLSRNTWYATVGDVETIVDEKLLVCVPGRVEDVDDPTSMFSWWHKSVGEYLCAWKFYNETETAIDDMHRCFSKDTPAIIRFFAEMCAGKQAGDQQRSALDLLAFVIRQTTSPVIMSNAVALLAGSSHSLTLNLENKEILDCNLYGAHLQKLRGACFEHCVLDNAIFDRPELQDTSFPSTTCEIPLPPLHVGGMEAITSIAVTGDGRRCVSGGIDGLVRVWNLSTGRETIRFGSTQHEVRAVALTEDGSLAISAGADSMVNMWDCDVGKNLHCLSGHQDVVFAVAFQQAKRIAVSGGDDMVVRAWDVQSGKQLRVFIGHTDRVTCLGASNDGQYLVSAGMDESIRVWHLQKGHAIHCVETGSPMSTLCLSSDSTKIVTGHKDKRLMLWQLQTGKPIGSFGSKAEEHTAAIMSVAISVNGTTIVSGSYDNSLRVWDVGTLRLLRQLAGHSNGVSSVHVNADGSEIISGSYDQSIRIWSITSRHQVRKLDGHGTSVTKSIFTADGSRIISCGEDCTIRIFDIYTGQEIRRLLGHTKPVTSLCLSVDNNLLVSGGFDKVVMVWNLNSAAVVSRFETAEWGIDAVTALAIDPRAQVFLAGDDQGHVLLWDLSSIPQWSVALHTPWGCTSLLFAQNQKKFVSSGKDSTIRICDASNGQQLRTMKMGDWVRCLAIAPDETRIYSAGDDRCIRIWDFNTGEKLNQIPQAHSKIIQTIDVSSDGMLLCSGGDKTIKVWGAGTGHEICRLEGHADDVLSIQMSQDCAKLLSCGQDAMIRLWEISAGRQPTKIQARTQVVTVCVLSPNMQHIIYGSSDGTVRMWECSTGEDSPRVLECHSSAVNEISFSATGITMATCGSDERVRLWNLQTFDRISTLKGHHLEVWCCAICPVTGDDGVLKVASGGQDNSVRLWNARERKEIYIYKGHSGAVTCICFTQSDGKILISGGDDGLIYLWDSTNGEKIRKFDGHKCPIKAMCLDPEGGKLVTTGTTDKSVKIWNFDGYKSHCSANRTCHAQIVKLAYVTDEIVLVRLTTGELLAWNIPLASFVAAAELVAEGAGAICRRFARCANDMLFWPVGRTIHVAQGFEEASPKTWSCIRIITSQTKLTIFGGKGKPAETEQDVPGMMWAISRKEVGLKRSETKTKTIKKT